MKRNICISAMYLRFANVGGTEQYLRNLLSGFLHVKEESFNYTIIANRDTANRMKTEWELPDRTQFETIGSYSGLIHSALNQSIKMPAIIRRNRTDLTFFPAYFTPYGIQPSVGTIHDMQHLHYPQNFSFAQRMWRLFAHYTTIKHSKIVVAISNYTANDIVRHYGRKIESKIRVIHNPITIKHLRPDPEKMDFFKEKIFDFSSPYILSVATAYPHKNFLTLIRAFAMKNNSLHDYKLVLTGRGFTADNPLKELIKELGIENKVVFTGYLDDGILGELYTNASAFVFPSLFEGFGMPPVEALLYGSPVITTRLTSIPEVTKGFAQYVDDPLDPRELNSLIAEVVLNRDKYSPSQEQINALESAYQPETVALDYLKVFKEVLSI